jgi:DNA-binding NarL/FixJ family response regulator
VSQLPFQLLLIDKDPIFLLGLSSLCQQSTDLEVVGQTTDGTQALALLSTRVTSGDFGARSRFTPERPVDLVILDLDLGRTASTGATSLMVMAELEERYPQVFVLLLGSEAVPNLEGAGFLENVKGYCEKGIAGAELIQAMVTVASGKSYWGEGRPTRVSNGPNSGISRRGGLIGQLVEDVRRSGLRQIDAELHSIEGYLQGDRLSDWNRLFWEGRRREVLTARWIVNQLLAPPVRDPLPPQRATQGDRRPPVNAQRQPNRISPSAERPNRPQSSSPSRFPLVRRPATADLVPATGPELREMPLPPQLLEAIAEKINTPLVNFTDTVMEIDILSLDKKQELLSVVLHQFEEILEQLRFAQVPVTELPGKRDRIIRDLWEMSITAYFGKYYSISVGLTAKAPAALGEFDLVPFLLEEIEPVEGALLNKIPLVLDLLAYLLYQIPLAIENVTYPPADPKSIERAGALLENLMIQTANAVIQPLLNRVADVEEIKLNFLDKHWLSTREIERFRNDLSWKYRRQNLWVEPKAIFESRHWLYIFEEPGIKKIQIYSPRRQELVSLRGPRLWVTLLLETRDAISPRIKAVLLSLGDSARYLLIQLGKGIGLIGRGILQGIGSSFQESRFSRNREEQNR